MPHGGWTGDGPVPRVAGERPPSPAFKGALPLGRVRLSPLPPLEGADASEIPEGILSKRDKRLSISQMATMSTLTVVYSVLGNLGVERREFICPPPSAPDRVRVRDILFLHIRKGNELVAHHPPTGTDERLHRALADAAPHGPPHAARLILTRILCHDHQGPAHPVGHEAALSILVERAATA